MKAELKTDEMGGRPTTKPGHRPSLGGADAGAAPRPVNTKERPSISFVEAIETGALGECHARRMMREPEEEGKYWGRLIWAAAWMDAMETAWPRAGQLKI